MNEINNHNSTNIDPNNKPLGFDAKHWCESGRMGDMLSRFIPLKIPLYPSFFSASSNNTIANQAEDAVLGVEHSFTIPMFLKYQQSKG